jgi:hypothetical protein
MASATVPRRGLDHLGGGLELDRAGEVEALALEVQRGVDDRPQVHVQVILVEGLRDGDDGHNGLLRGCSDGAARRNRDNGEDVGRRSYTHRGRWSRR